MLRVLTLSTLFPNAAEPVLGVFVERQTLGLAALEDVTVEVVAPIGLPPWPLSRHPHYRARAALPRRETWKGLSVHRPRYPVLPVIGARWTARSLARRLVPYLGDLRRRCPFDVIDAEFFWPDGPAAVAAARALGVPCSIKARGSDIHLWGKVPSIADQVAAAGCAANGVLAVSEALRRDMIALGMPAARIAVHRTGVDADRFVPVDRTLAKAALGVSGPLLVGVGSLIPGKGHDRTIAALPRLEGATLLIVGGGPEQARLAAQAAALGLGDRVRLLGRQPHEALPGLLAAADVMVLPSAAEGLANAWVEALACGTPLVIAEAGGAREVVDRPEVGRIVARTPEAIAAAVADLLTDPPEPLAVRAASERFSWQRNATELRDHLARLVGGHRSKPQHRSP